MEFDIEEIDQDILLIAASVWGVSIIIAKVAFSILMRNPSLIKYGLTQFKRLKKEEEMIMNQTYIELMKPICNKYGVDINLICAIVNQESAWNPKAIRYEPSFNYLLGPAKFANQNNISVDTEANLQKMSYGLCQLMGANARWMGFQGTLVDLLDPALNLEVGIKFFHEHCDIYPDIKDKISSYNGGHPLKKAFGGYVNQSYVDKVFSYYQDLQKKPEK